MMITAILKRASSTLSNRVIAAANSMVGDSDQKLADGISLHSIVTDQYVKAGILASLMTMYPALGAAWLVWKFCMKEYH